MPSVSTPVASRRSNPWRVLLIVFVAFESFAIGATFASLYERSRDSNDESNVIHSSRH